MHIVIQDYYLCKQNLSSSQSQKKGQKIKWWVSQAADNEK